MSFLTLAMGCSLPCTCADPNQLPPPPLGLLASPWAGDKLVPPHVPSVTVAAGWLLAARGITEDFGKTTCREGASWERAARGGLIMLR